MRWSVVAVALAACNSPDTELATHGAPAPTADAQLRVYDRARTVDEMRAQ